MNLRHISCPLFVAAILQTGGLHAETVWQRPQAKAVQIDALPSWDKVFSDPCWQKAAVTALLLQAPSNVTFLTAPEKTEVRALWCKDFLLVRFDCTDQSIVYLPGGDAARATRDLLYFKADAAEVFLDPVGDARMYMEFEFSPNNGVFDAIYFCTTAPRSKADFSLEDNVASRDLFSIKEWNLAGLQTAARIWPDSEGRGWSVIAAFPAKEILHRLRKTEFAPGMEMKVNFVRFNYFSDARRPLEITNWAPVLAGCAHVSPVGMGTLILGSQ
jgi:hypothetical protein